MSEAALLPALRELERAIRSAVIESCEEQSSEQLSTVAQDLPGDTIFAIDKVSEAVLVRFLEDDALKLGGVVLIAEGLEHGSLVLPRDLPERQATWRLLVDPIDGTRGIMYQKRSAWVLCGAAPNRGPNTRFSDITLAVQTEIPTLKQHLCDELWAVRGQGGQAERFNRLSTERTRLSLQPTRAPSIVQGYAMISRFFPGARDELAAIDEEIMQSVLGPAGEGKALCFEDQYASTGGQLYELMSGHDRFNADLRPLMQPTLAARGQGRGLCCHPYDLCTELIAREYGVLITDPAGDALDTVLELDLDVAWVGYANAAIRQQMEPVLRAALAKRGLLGA